jgi:dTMP kinase
MKNEILKGFIVIEGLDGAGTTTQLNNITDYLIEKNIRHKRTFEPTENRTGLFLREVLSGKIPLEQETIAYLFAADRNEHIYNKKEGIIKILETEEYVICDRYLFSSIAYQSINADPEFVRNLNSRFPLPEYLIFVDVPVEECQKRLQSRDIHKDIYDDIETQRKVLQYYNESINQFSNSEMKLIRVDGTKLPEDITTEIKERVFSSR